MLDRPARATFGPEGALRPARHGTPRRGLRREGHRFVRLSRMLALSWLLASTAPARGHASPGQLDETFAGFGALGVASMGQNVMCHAVAPDGRIVLAGTSGTGIVVSRRLANGSPDYSFGGDGTVSVSHPSGSIAARSVAVQPDGKIVVAGQGDYDGSTDFLVVRLTTSGSLDPGFSGNGFASAWVSPVVNQAEKVLLQPDGKIVVAGSSLVQGDWDFSAARFNANGTLDPTFGGDGMVSVGGFQAFGGHDKCYDAVLQADGKLVMVGGTEGFSLLDEDFALARLNIDGSLDGSFDGDGRVKTGFGDFYDRAYAVAIQPSDQRIVVVGQGSSLGAGGRAARYYSSDGSLDGSFDGDGKMNLPFIAYDAAINTAGRITLIGIDPDEVATVLRLNANGSSDPQWSGDGYETVDTGIAEPPSLSILADGRVLTVVPKGLDCRLRQYWADGLPDDGGGQVAAFDDATFRPGSQEIAHDMAIQSDGRIVVAGQVSTPGNTETDFALARFLTDGRLDDTFGVRGRVSLSLGNFDYGKAVAIQPDGKIVVAGYTGTGNAVNFMIARFNASGSLDNTFGFGGYNAVDFAGGPDYGWALALQPDGRIVVAGTVYNGARNVFGVARFDSDGTLDHSFDVDGKQLYEFSVGPDHWATSVVIQGGTLILVGGSVGGNFAVVRLTSAGAVDYTFGNGSGRVSRDLGGADYLETLAIGTDGRIYAAGTRVAGGNSDWALTRWPGSGGLVLCNPVCPWTSTFVDFGSSYGSVSDLRVRTDGRLVIAGSVDGATMRWYQFAPGATTPEAGGVAAFPGTMEGLAVGFAGAGHVVAAGYHLFQNDRNMTIARFETIPNTTVSVEEEPMAIGPSLRLAAPSPNPLVGRSTFAFELPRTQRVRLAVHDASGRLVRMLMDGELTAGRHHRLWDGTDDRGRSVAAGVYFARLVAGAEHASASIVVLH